MINFELIRESNNPAVGELLDLLEAHDSVIFSKSNTDHTITLRTTGLQVKVNSYWYDVYVIDFFPQHIMFTGSKGKVAFNYCDVRTTDVKEMI